jgi:protein LSM14
MNAQEQNAAAAGQSPVPPVQAAAAATPKADTARPQPHVQATRPAAANGQGSAAKDDAPTGATRPSDPVRSASATLEKVERAMDELRTQPAGAPTSAAPASHSGRGGRRGGRGGGGGGGGQSSRVQVPDTAFDFDAMNAKFDKASLRPNESESESDSEESEDHAPDEAEKKDNVKFYNPQRSFFDDISSDSNLKNEGGANLRGIKCAFFGLYLDRCLRRSRAWSWRSFRKATPRGRTEP